MGSKAVVSLKRRRMKVVIDGQLKHIDDKNIISDKKKIRLFIYIMISYYLIFIYLKF